MAFLWAKTLGGESAVKLLTKFGLLEQGIDYACEAYQFEFAFELARLAAQNKTQEIHYKYAMALEDEGKFRDAETQFVQANKPKEAVLMYVHAQDWESAQRVAEAHDPDSVADVLIGQAKVAFESGDFARFESMLLRAQRPELAVKHYRDSGMWPEALRVCKEYLPHRLKSLQDEYDRESMAESAGNVEMLLQKARQWEEQGEYERAVECYLKVDRSNCSSTEVMADSWSRAAELAVKFLDGERAVEVAEEAGPRLVQVGRHSSAAQLYMGVEMIKEAVDAFVDAQEWTKARKVARELEPRLESYVEQRYKDHLQNQGQFDELVNVDLERALNVLVDNGEWEKAIETAGEQGSQELKHKYVAHHATQLIRDGDPVSALKLYRKHGAPAMLQNFNIYKRMAVDLFSMASEDDVGGKAYTTWSGLRDVLYDLTQSMAR